MKVPGPSVPQKRSSAEPKVEEKNSAKEAQGLRYAEAAEDAGHSWRCGGLDSVRWFIANISRRRVNTRQGDVENGTASSRLGATPFWARASPLKRRVFQCSAFCTVCLE